jgi:transcriptional regulator with PAS, ATPase and Fis domain
MGNFVKNQGISEERESFNHPNITENGLKFGDVINISPMYGKSFSVSLNRAEFHLNLSSKWDSKKEGFEIFLPYSEGDKEHKFLLYLDSKERYLLKSLSDIPFMINGTYTFESYITRSDCIGIGMNKVDCRKKELSRLETISTLTQKRLEELGDKAVRSSINILLEGETGSGKSFLAKEIHKRSGRAGKFVSININSFSENLIESELFGHNKGAFSGAIHSKVGVIEEADRGTLFLDEIDSLPLNLQVKLLLFFDTLVVRRVGGVETKKLDVRIILSSGRKLKELVNNGRIRKDFYFRIAAGVTYRLPSLLENKEMINMICNEFSLKESLFIPRSLLLVYRGYHWPGNIRQLVCHLEKKKVTGAGSSLKYGIEDDQLLHEDFHFPEIGQFSKPGEIRPLKDVKNDYCLKVYNSLDGCLKTASHLLGISTVTMRSIVKTEVLSLQ